MTIRQLLRQAEEMREKLQRELREMRVIGTTGGGVTVTMDGAQEILSVEIDPEILNADNRELVQDLIVAAVNETRRRVDKTIRQKMSSLAASMPSPF